MEEHRTYEQQLRAIGQSLEAQRIHGFELTQQGDRFIVKGEPEKEISLLAALRNWQKSLRRQSVNGSLDFSPDDIEDLDRQGRTQRAQSNRLPDFHRLPNTLRTVGSYLDLKGAKLVGLHKRQFSITILSQNRAGHPEFEERTVASFYNHFVQRHAQRGRSAPRR